MNEHLKSVSRAIIFESPTTTIYRIPDEKSPYQLEEEIKKCKQSVLVVFLSANKKIVPINGKLAVSGEIQKNDIEETARRIIQKSGIKISKKQLYIGRLIADPAVASHTTHIYACKTDHDDAENMKTASLELAGLLAGRYALKRS